MTKFIQFIAGAKCPQCNEIDTIALSPDNNKIYCVKCSYSEQKPKDNLSKNTKINNVINITDYRENKDKN